jgi:NAD-dependent SIR2 family protein deacetylase
MYSRRRILKSMDTLNSIDQLKEALEQSDAVIIGAGAGLSTSAGFIYTGERFQKYFQEVLKKVLTWSSLQGVL